MFGKLRRLIIALFVADILLTQVALLVADSARRWLPLGQDLSAANTFLNPYLHLMILVLWPIVFAVTAVYDIRRNVRPVGEARALFIAVSTATFAFSGALYFTFRDVPRLLVIYFYLFDLLLLTSARLAAGLLLRLLHAGCQPAKALRTASSRLRLTPKSLRPSREAERIWTTPAGWSSANSTSSMYFIRGVWNCAYR